MIGPGYGPGPVSLSVAGSAVGSGAVGVVRGRIVCPDGPGAPRTIVGSMRGTFGAKVDDPTTGRGVDQMTNRIRSGWRLALALAPIVAVALVEAAMRRW